MLERRFRSGAVPVLAGALILVLISGCGFQKFPEDRTVDTIPPAPPTNLVAVGGDQIVDLTWVFSVDYDVTDYYVYIKVESGPDFGPPISVGLVNAVQIYGLANGVTYRVRVQAVDASGNLSEPENAAEATFNTFPDPPTDLVLTPVWQSPGLALLVEWTHTISTTLDGYNLYVSTDGGVIWSDPIDVGSDSDYTLVTFQDASGPQTIQYGTTYDIALETYDEQGLASSYQTGQVLMPPAPVPVGTFNGFGGDLQVILFWAASPSPTTVGYTLFTSDDGGTTWDSGQDVGNVSPVTLTQDAAGTPFVNGHDYTFRLQSRDAQNQLSIPADAAEITVTPSDVPQPPPNPVQNLTAVPGDEAINIHWVPPIPMVPQFEISWNDTGSLTDFPNIFYVSSSVTSISIPPPSPPYPYFPALTNGVQYTIRVRSVGASTSIVSSPEFAWATPGAPNVVVEFSDEGGAYRAANLPSLVLSGIENKANPGTGVIYYTVDGSNPVISAGVLTPNATGVSDGTTSLGTFVQANTSTGIGIPLDLSQFSTQDFVQVKAMFDPNGTTTQTAGDGDEGITVAVTYFIFNANVGDCVPVGGTIESRKHHAAILLADGRVLLTGGRSAGGVVHRNSEIFNKNIEFFTASGQPTTPRAEHVAVTLDDANGTVLQICGRRQVAVGIPVNFTSDLAQDGGTEFAVEAFDPTTGTFAGLTGAAVTATPRVLHGALRLSERTNLNRVLIIGGVQVTSGAVVTDFASINSSQSAVFVQPGNAGLASVAVGDILVFSSGNTVNESQIISGILPPSSTMSGEWIFYLINSLSASPAPPPIASFTVYRATYGGCQWYDPNPPVGHPVFNMGPGFYTAPTMPDDRFGHDAVLLQDGRILVTGGHYPPNPALTDKELTILILDPTQNNSQGLWERCGGGGAGFANNSAKMQKNRFFHTATVLMDGKVLISGGIDDGTGYFSGTSGEGNYRSDRILKCCDLVNVAGRSAVEITTQKTGDMKEARFFHSATLLRDGRVLLTGGVNYLTSAGDIDATASAEIYDPSTGKYAYTGCMLEPRHGHQATLLGDGRVLITGGRADYLPEIYDPATGKFSATAGTMTGNHRYHASSVRLPDGRILISGGQRPNQLNRTTDQTSAGPIVTDTETLDARNSLFTALDTPISVPRAKHTMTLIDDGRVLIAGGEGGTGTTPVALSSTDLYDPASGTMTDGPTMSARYGHSDVKLNPVLTWTTGTATFNGTTTITGTGTGWQSVAGILPGDRIRFDPDVNNAYFEIAAVVSDTQLTVLSGAGFGFPIPSGTSTYTIRIERPYTTGTATFGNNSTTVTGTGTAWDLFLSAGDVIRPTATAGFYMIASVDSATQITLARTFADRSSPGGAPEAYIAQGNSKILLLGGGRNGLPLTTGEIFNPYTNAFEGAWNTMTLGRYQHTATLLPNGWVLIVGGNSNWDRTAELFDPASVRFRLMVLPIVGTSVTSASRNNHTAQLMSNGSVLLAGGEVAQNVAEIFIPDFGGNPLIDVDGDGIAGIDYDTTGTIRSFQALTSTMNAGRVEHTMTYIPGATETVLFVGGTTSNANGNVQLLTWGSPPVFGAPAPLARAPMQAHSTSLMMGTDNVLIMRGHTVQVYFTK